MQQRRNSEFEARGYFIANDVLSEKGCRDLESNLPETDQSGTRALLEVDCFSKLGLEIKSKPNLVDVLTGLIPVQGIYFRKTLDHNWSVPLHRDKIIPIDGTGPWKRAGVKDGLNSAHAPFEFLEKCVTVRVALDDCEDGDLRVIPGSHSNERNNGTEMEETVRVLKGHALVLRPNLLHASSKLALSKSRRVLHYLYAPSKPPHNYRWYHAA